METLGIVIKYFSKENISVAKYVEKPGLFRVYGFVGRKIMFIVAAWKCDKTQDVANYYMIVLTYNLILIHSFEKHMLHTCNNMSFQGRSYIGIKPGSHIPMYGMSAGYCR